MTIDEAIAHEKEKADKNSQCWKYCTDISCIECEKEHKQLAEWLEELNLLRLQNHLGRDEAFNAGRKQGYNMAIDDFAILMKETLNHDWATTKISEQIIYNRLFDKCNEIAEQLKSGERSERN